MREAVGGSMLFYIILIFLGVYIIFIGVIINYAATYRASNYVLTRLEQTEGQIELGSINDTDSVDTLSAAVKSRKYYNKLCVSCSDTSNGAIFKIRTEVIFDLPLLTESLRMYINNETKTIYNIRCEDTTYTSVMDCNS